MAKVSRSVLKELVKECLVEILSEGLVSTVETIRESRPRKSKKNSKNISSDVFQQRNKMLNEKTKRKVPKINVDHMTDDPIMREIFADTAATTLQAQPISESAGKPDFVPGDAAAKVVHESSLEDLFEGSNKWASLAFSGGKN
jgi:hypothetical protein